MIVGLLRENEDIYKVILYINFCLLTIYRYLNVFIFEFNF